MDGSSRPPVDVAIDQRLDDLQRTLLRLLARRRRHSWVDDPELKKVLATLYEHVCEARRLHSISDDGKREVADRALARLVDADETQLRELDAARAVADGFKQALVQFGTAEYCNVLLAAEDRQRTDDRGIATPSPERAVEELLLRYRRRANESRHREARRRIKARY